MFFSSEICLSGSKYGVELWLFTVLPTLLPFIILSNILVNLNVCSSIAKYIHPITKRLFHTSIYGSYVIIIGFLCGYPMGAKTISDLVGQKKLSVSEGQYLLSFCNNPSPMYIMGYIAGMLECSNDIKIKLFCTIYLSAYITSLLYRKMCKPLFAKESASELLSKDNDAYNIWQIFEKSILNGFFTIFKLGGYIIIFSIIANIILNASPFPQVIKILSACIVEITSGAYYISHMEISLIVKLIIIISTTMFGGFSINAQTAGVISDSELNFVPYIKYKIISGVLSGVIMFIFLSL